MTDHGDHSLIAAADALRTERSRWSAVLAPKRNAAQEREDSKEICYGCEGSGQGQFESGVCWRCHGSGEVIYNQE